MKSYLGITRHFIQSRFQQISLRINMRVPMIRQLLILTLLAFVSVTAANAQKTEITISLNEQFFDALLDAIYQNSPPPEFQLSRSNSEPADRMSSTSSSGFVQRST